MSDPKFPRRLFVEIEERGSAEEWLHAEPLADDLAEKGKVVEIAEYKLVRKLKLRTRIEEVR